MDTCPLIIAGFLKEDIIVGKLELTEQGQNSLKHNALKADLLRIAGTCTMATCRCIYRDMPEQVPTRT